MTNNCFRIQLLDKSETIIKQYDRKIIESHQIDNELLSMMFTKNLDDTLIIPRQLIYSHLTDGELEILSHYGCIQFNMDEMDNEFRQQNEFFDYKSILNSIEVIPLHIPKTYKGIDVYYCRILDSDGDSITLPDDSTSFQLKDGSLAVKVRTSAQVPSDKLLLITESADKVSTISQQLHDNMLNPHNELDKYILYMGDLNKFINKDLIIDYIDRQNGVKLGDEESDYEDLNNTELIKGIYDSVSNKYSLDININSREL